ncbi:hypothetical protein KS4_16320 [Poriferisphaera corsica]|uniref:Uncharacterized protein n=1 Tax=Poriferisphaera corsica TaxID=2528020 RepID=A0A517YTM8_9BACT|nr:PEP-CTERM sorting domain-containing protein [Poriferisphaera corsica]QDU33581.1 hypothetical protein KS4_16320 [Poriferisphaera corsica]
MKFVVKNIVMIAVMLMGVGQVWGMGMAMSGPKFGGGGAAPMKHLDIELVNNAIQVHIDETVPMPILAVSPDTYAAEKKYSILNGKAFNGQYGWNPRGFFSGLNTATQSIWVEMISMSDGLNVYEGGMGMTVDMHTFDPILGTQGSANGAIWEWNGTMVHNWYAADAPGEYSATYKVYVGDKAGNELSSFVSDTLTIQFVPEPASVAVVGLMGISLLGLRRKKA